MKPMRIFLGVTVFVVGVLGWSAASINFMLLGDWGLPCQNQTLIAKQMSDWAETNHAAFVVALGDNFYYNGVTSVDDYQWYATFTSVFVSDSLQIPWYAILGNHDYKGKPDAQIEYTKKRMDERWTMPGHLYSAMYNSLNGKPEVHIVDSPTVPDSGRGVASRGEKKSSHLFQGLEVVFIDTLIMAPAEDETTRLGGKDYVTPEEASAYLAAVEGVLATSSAKWLMVAGHYPVYSVADHGDTKYLIDKLAPLLRKYGVCAYFNGHDHVLQHLEHDGVSYFTSGHGTHVDNFPLGAYNARLNSPEAFEGYKYSRNGPGFIAAKSAEDVLEIEFIDKWGNVLYSTSLSSKRSGSSIYNGGPRSIGQFMWWLLLMTALFLAILVLVCVSNTVFPTLGVNNSCSHSCVEIMQKLLPSEMDRVSVAALDLERGCTPMSNLSHFSCLCGYVRGACSYFSTGVFRVCGNVSVQSALIGLMGCILLIVYLYPLYA